VTGDALVVGAGITGLAASLLLARRGWRVELVDAADEPGGLLAGVPFEGRSLDRGSHRVHTDAHPLLTELTASEHWTPRPRRGVLVLGDRSVEYPLRLGAFLRALGPRAAVAMGAGWALRPGQLRRFRRWEADRGEPTTDDEGFADFVRARVGSAAFERFYRPYVEKGWGEAAAHLSRTIARQRVSVSSPWDSLRAQARPSSATFLYPTRAMAGLIEHLVAEVRRAGVELRFGRPFVSDDARGGRPVVFTGRLPELAPAAGLRHRGLYLLHLAMPRGSLAEADTWYVPDARYWFGRVSRPERFSPALQVDGREVLCVEIPEGRWGADVDFVARADELLAQLRAAGVVRTPDAALALRQTFVPSVYPLYERGWVQRWRGALATATALGEIYPVGRQGLFLHCNMDHCVHMAAELVEHLDARRGPREWLARCDRWLDLRVRD